MANQQSVYTYVKSLADEE